MFDEAAGGGDESGDSGAPMWIVTFADLMSLLLTFFILLLSFSHMDPVKFKEVSGSLELAFGVQRINPMHETPKGETIIMKDMTAKKGYGNLVVKLHEMSESTQAKKAGAEAKIDIEVFEDYRGIVLRCSDGSMFASGRASLSPTAWPFLDDVLSALEGERVDIQVEAHTDNRPIKSKTFETNWHLSAARAVSVIQYFKEAGKIAPRRLLATGRGDSIPIVPNINRRNRAKNRRVEIIFSRQAEKKRVDDD